MNEELKAIRYQLIEISEREATKLYRLARRMEEHNCKRENIHKCRLEASWLHLNGQVELLITPYQKYDYAFKF